MNMHERSQRITNPKEESFVEVANDNESQTNEIISRFKEVRARIDAGDLGAAELLREWAHRDLEKLSERSDPAKANVIALQHEAEALYKELNPD